MNRTCFKQRFGTPLVTGLLALMMVLGSFSGAYAQDAGNRILLPLVQSGTSVAKAVSGPFASVPSVDIADPEVSAASKNLGCVNYTFSYYLDGTKHSWNGNWPVRSGPPSIVKYIQWDLVYIYNQDIGNYGPNSDGVDGYYGWRTANAVKNVQRNFRHYDFEACGSQIAVDGIVGPQTWAILFSNK